MAGIYDEPEVRELLNQYPTYIEDVILMFQKYKDDKLYGRVLTSDGLRLICVAENYDLEAIDKRMLETLSKVENKPY